MKRLRETYRTHLVKNDQLRKPKTLRSVKEEQVDAG